MAATRRTIPTAASASPVVDTLGSPEARSAVLPTPIGPLTLEAGETGLRLVWFGERDATAEAPRGSHPVLDAAVVQLGEYFRAERRAFDLPLDVSRGTAFQREAWLALAQIAYGETTTYGEQARRLGRPGAARAVGAVNGRNPLPIVLPCHRVIGAGGALTGFGGGLPTKRALLDHERGALSWPEAES